MDDRRDGRSARRAGARQRARFRRRSVTAAEGAHEQHLRVDGTRTQVGGEAPLRDHVGLGSEDGEIAGDAGAVALGREVVGRFGRCLRRVLLALLANDRLRRADLVGDVVDRFDQRAVVDLDCSIEIGGAAAQAGAQAPGVEDRQTNRRADAVLLAAGTDQTIEAEARQAENAIRLIFG